MTISVILPVHNERENLEPLLVEIDAALKQYPNSEIIAVDDGSLDDSLTELKRLQSLHPSLVVIELARNYGQTAALAAGMDSAIGEVIIPMDADMQNDPKDIPLLMAKIAEGYDIVSGWRKNRRDGWLRSAVSKVANRIIRFISGQPIHDYGCTLKAYRRSAVEHLGLYGDMHRFLAAYAGAHGARVAEVIVHHRPRTRGVSKYGFGRIWRVFLDLFLLLFYLRSFTRPMQFFGGIGLTSIILGFITIILAFVWREVGGPTFIETPLPVLAALLEIVGVQCILMGVLAEMIMRSYFQGQNRKPYIVRSTS